jgi:colanic acid/amylovoran biosynthesis glycosyltransferase
VASALAAAVGDVRPRPRGQSAALASADPRPDRAPFARTGPRRRLGSLSARTGYAGVFDRTVRTHRPRLVHAHFGTDAAAVLPVSQRLRLPLVVTFHGYDVLHAPATDPRYAARLSDLFAGARVLLAVSDFLADRLVDLGAPPAKVRVHYLGIPVHKPFASLAAPREGIAFIGRLRPRKGADDLISAYARLPPYLRRANPLLIVGDGPQRAELEERARAVPDGTITFLGVQPPPEVADVLRSCLVFAGPSKSVPDGDTEAFGLVYLEAALAGAAVIAYAEGGVPEAVVDGVTGLLSPPADVARLAANLERLLTDAGLRARLGAAGQRRVIDAFDIVTRTAVLEALYDEVAGL